MNSSFPHDHHSSLAADLLGAAVFVIAVWGAFTTLFEVPNLHETTTKAQSSITTSSDVYDSVMTGDGWLMLASR